MKRCHRRADGQADGQKCSSSCLVAAKNDSLYNSSTAYAIRVKMPMMLLVITQNIHV